MPALIFMPWVGCAATIELDQLLLAPYERHQKSSDICGIAKSTVDAILGSYGDPTLSTPGPNARPVQHATLAIWKGAGDSEVDDAAIMARLAQMQYVVFAALANRNLFAHMGYCNTDACRVVAQRFDPANPGRLAVTHRRRDGNGMHYLGDSTAPRFIRSTHIGNSIRLNIEPALVNALLRMPLGTTKDNIDGAIGVFLNANTDSPAVLERTEVVLTRIAFETLLETNHETAELRKSFAAHFRGEVPTDVEWGSGQLNERTWRDRWSANVARPLDAWVQDFCSSRNAAAHGPKAAHMPPVWSTHNHLLFASALFPRMVKKVLADAGLYSLSAEDRAWRKGFEAFFAHDISGRVDPQKPECWWSKVEGEMLGDIWLDEVFRPMVQKHLDDLGSA